LLRARVEARKKKASARMREKIAEEVIRIPMLSGVITDAQSAKLPPVQYA